MSTQGLLFQRRVYTVSELNEEIRGALETHFVEVWVEGEISNFRAPGSGHYYLTLKDDTAQLRAVCFRSQNRLIRFRPEDGLAILARGRITVYEPRGEYQLVIDYMEPQGRGSLQLAFEQLKEKLQKEGLFDAGRKRRLPLLPQKIGVITSPTGAAIRDILRVLQRRNRSLHVLIFPVRVQGEGAGREIAAALRYLNTLPDLDVILVGRGGGSIEDLWAFNEEVVARAIHASRIPVISAVGHEVDYTIADFVADVRAPTPSAAAEMVSAVRDEQQEQLRSRLARMQKSVRFLVDARRHSLKLLAHSRAFGLVEGRIRVAQQRVDELGLRALAGTRAVLGRSRDRHTQADRRLEKSNPLQVLRQRRAQLKLDGTRLRHAVGKLIDAGGRRFSSLTGKLNALSPLGILGRGYAICQRPEGAILTDAAGVRPQDPVRVRLARGLLECEVTRVQEE